MEPHEGVGFIFGDAASEVIERGEVGLCFGVSLFGGFAVPVGGGAVVPGVIEESFVEGAEGDLGEGVILFGGELEPHFGGGDVWGDGPAELVDAAEVVLGGWVSVLCEWCELLEGGVEVLVFDVIEGFLEFVVLGAGGVGGDDGDDDDEYQNFHSAIVAH